MRMPFSIRNDARLVERWLSRLIRQLSTCDEAASGCEATLATIEKDGEEYAITLRYSVEMRKILPYHDMPVSGYGRLELSVTEHSPRDRSIICRVAAWRGSSGYLLEYPRPEAELPPPRGSLSGTWAERRRARVPLSLRRAQTCLEQIGRDWLRLRTWSEVAYAAAHRGQPIVPDTALSSAKPANCNINRGLSSAEGG